MIPRKRGLALLVCWMYSISTLAFQHAGLRMVNRPVVFVRHGESTFNKFNCFTGWYDCALSDQGIEESSSSGQILRYAGAKFDVVHTSVLRRACQSTHNLLEGLDQQWVPIKTSWRLNERHYGALTGINKAEAEAMLGPIVREWRKGYDVRPPKMQPSHPVWRSIMQDSRYEGINIPLTESIKDCAKRAMGYWEREIVPDIRAGKRVLIVSHANTIRSMVHSLDSMSNDALKKFSVPTGKPLVYYLDENMRPVGQADENGCRGTFIDGSDILTPINTRQSTPQQASFIRLEDSFS